MINAIKFLKELDSLFFSDEEGEGNLRKWCYGGNALAIALYLAIKTQI